MKKHINRREFIAGAAAFCVALKLPAFATNGTGALTKPVKVGIITDLHQDIMHDGLERITEFVKHMKKISPDALMQMGDFAMLVDKNKPIVDLFNGAHEQVLHVIGNHDMDGGFTNEQCVQHWGMPSRYYLKDVGGIIFLVLDGNDKGSPKYNGGYHSFINDEQLAWLDQQLSAAAKPVIVVSHQPLAGPADVDNAEAVQEVLGRHAAKILLALNGHTHIDAVYEVKGVTHVHINSASYFWLGEEYKHESYTEAVHSAHPSLASTAPYKNALFATMTVDPDKGVIRIEGRKSEWVGSSPEQLKFDAVSQGFDIATVVPTISTRAISKKKT